MSKQKYFPLCSVYASEKGRLSSEHLKIYGTGQDTPEEANEFGLSEHGMKDTDKNNYKTVFYSGMVVPVFIFEKPESKF